MSYPREREKRNNRKDEREGQGRKRNRNESEETKNKNISPLLLPTTRIAGLAATVSQYQLDALVT